METGIVRAKQEKFGYGAGNPGGLIVITLTIPTEIYQECRQKGWHYKEVFLAGMTKKRGDPELADRITELEEGNKKLQGKLSQFWQQMAAIDAKKEDK